jgi:hypothetical protein
MNKNVDDPLFNYFKLVKTADIFHEDRRNSATITTHFMKNSDRFSGA